MIAQLPPIAHTARPLSAPARAWLNLLCWSSVEAPGLAHVAKPLVLSCAWRFSESIRTGTLANARRVVACSNAWENAETLARRMVESFYDFMVEVGGGAGSSATEDADVVGLECFERAASRGRGIIIATAHLGSFEVGIRALAGRGLRTAVLFHRDQLSLFEHCRTRHRECLGVRELHVEDGAGVWKDALETLRSGGVVLVQADRCLPGQTGVPVGFLGGRLRAPLGPVKLAGLSGAPILPTFTVRSGGGHRVCMEPPIEVRGPLPAGRSTPEELLRLTAVIERYIIEFADQWLMLEPALLEDAVQETGRG